MTLTLERLDCRLGGTPVLEGIAGLEARPGEITALVGPNGAGKSTLLKAIAGLERADGSLLLHGQELMTLSLERRARYLYYLPQELGSRAVLNVFEAVLLARRTCIHESHERALRKVQATLQALELEPLAERELGQLSGGQRQRVAIAQAVTREPSLLLLDEPTSALDLHHQLQVLDWLSRLAAQRHIIVIIAIHDLSLAARFAHHMWMLKAGRVAASGTPGDVLTHARLRDVYAIEAHIEWPDDEPPRITPLTAIHSLGR
ncbi:ABC transporter ATP-binding protein [Chromohalobacter nigrandesensis]|uniref:ABC transporter ATP-binding protein n=1 Tax=Chromohalobacter nigrandesensis TaxID=119863 RepID=UPI001FF6E444|nr:ABC transporter ATP-binding protein [Chromohalobacter nigrandesensis]MCK0746438.1 ABC transporter ATP-binding protein [Chromohalobacter nigrandesensis]